MKKITFLIFLAMLFTKGYGQVLNESAAWPNPAWTITGEYNPAAAAFESDPLTTANFAYDDDDAGNTAHEDNIAAESPVIDLTPAFTANEFGIVVNVMYGYRYLADDRLRFEYWDADASEWVAWSGTLPNNSTTINDNFCTIPKVNFTTPALDISDFTATQLSGFRYRISYDDNPNGTDWNYGFCFDSPTISSISCFAPTVEVSDVTGQTATIAWTGPAGATFEYVVDTEQAEPASGTTTTDLSYGATGLEFTTQYYAHVRIVCTGGASDWVTVGFMTGHGNETCATAIDLGAETSPLSGTTVGSLNDNLTVCNNSNQTVANTHGDLYYSILVPSGSTLTIGQDDNGYDSANIVFYGDCDNVTSIDCWDDSDTKVIVWANDTGEDQTVYWVQDGWSGNGTFILEWSVVACSNPTATYAVVSDCDNSGGFMVNVTVEDLGSATSITAEDDQGGASQSISDIGDYVFGPYDNGTDVIITLTNDQDGDCSISSPVQTQDQCPPANDTCETAINLDNETSPLQGTTVASTNDNLNVCNNSGETVANTYGDVYYSITVEAGSTLTIGQSVNNYDSANVVFYGDCDNRTQIDCWDDDDDDTIVWANDTGETQTVYWIQDGWSGVGTFTLEWSVIPCQNPAATFTVVPDCENGEQFLVEVDLTSLGSATSVTLYDDQGIASANLTDIGVYTYGPYANGTPVIVTIDNDQSGECTISSNTLNQTACPPVNDECEAAIELTVNADYSCTVATAGSTDGATGSSQPDDVSGTPGRDVWFWFTATGPAHRISLTGITAISGTSTDMGIGVYNGAGTCSALVFQGTSDPETYNITGLTADVVYYVRVYNWYGGGNTNAFNICIGTPPPPPANDNFADAIPLACDATVTGSTELATIDENNAPDGGGADLDAPNVWYTYTGTGTEQTITLDLCGSTYDTSVLVYTGTSGNLTFVAANDDAGEEACGEDLGTRSLVNFTSDGTTTYYITIEGWNAASIGSYTMEVTCSAVTPPAVPNQTCDTALAVATDGTVYESDNSFGTVNPVQTSCDTFGSIQDVWFSFVAPASGSVELEAEVGTMTSMSYNLYSGTCGALTGLGGACTVDVTEDSGTLSGLTAGATYYMQVWSNAAEQGTFTFSVTDTNLGTGNIGKDNFVAYPNPVRDVLTISDSKTITSVDVYNLLGARVASSTAGASEARIDLSPLAAGSYIVKVLVEGVVKTIRILKD